MFRNISNNVIELASTICGVDESKVINSAERNVRNFLRTLPSIYSAEDLCIEEQFLLYVTYMDKDKLIDEQVDNEEQHKITDNTKRVINMFLLREGWASSRFDDISRVHDKWKSPDGYFSSTVRVVIDVDATGVITVNDRYSEKLTDELANLSCEDFNEWIRQCVENSFIDMYKNEYECLSVVGFKFSEDFSHYVKNEHIGDMNIQYRMSVGEHRMYVNVKGRIINNDTYEEVNQMTQDAVSDVIDKLRQRALCGYFSVSGSSSTTYSSNLYSGELCVNDKGLSVVISNYNTNNSYKLYIPSSVVIQGYQCIKNYLIELIENAGNYEYLSDKFTNEGWHYIDAKDGWYISKSSDKCRYDILYYDKTGETNIIITDRATKQQYKVRRSMGDFKLTQPMITELIYDYMLDYTGVENYRHIAPHIQT